MDHFLSYKEIETDSLENLIKKITKKKKTPIKDLKLIDLIFEKKSLNGIYIIFNSENIAVYIGKTGSRAILERIAAHFDMRENAFMNNFLCALTGKFKGRKNTQATELEIYNTYDLAIEHKILFIEISKNEIINRLERILISELRPKLNRHLNTKPYNTKTIIKELL